MTAETPAYLLHQMLFGGVAAAGFGILFNFGFRQLFWCVGMGALALAVRTLGTDAGWSVEAASFLAALAVGGGVRVLRSRLGMTGGALAVAGCIPMVPGSFAAQAIFGLFSLSSSSGAMPEAAMAVPLEYMLRVAFTIGAIGAGLSISTHVLRDREF